MTCSMTLSYSCLSAYPVQGSDASLDVVLQTRTLFFPRDLHRAGTIGKELFQQIERGSDRVCGGVGAEVTCAVALGATASEVDAGELVVEIDLDVRDRSCRL